MPLILPAQGIQSQSLTDPQEAVSPGFWEQHLLV